MLDAVPTKSGWRYISSFSPLAYRLKNLPANGKQEPVPEMSKTPLTNKEQRKIHLRDATNIIKPT
jgi:hypothetical protein